MPEMAPYVAFNGLLRNVVWDGKDWIIYNGDETKNEEKYSKLLETINEKKEAGVGKDGRFTITKFLDTSWYYVFFREEKSKSYCKA